MLSSSGSSTTIITFLDEGPQPPAQPIALGGYRTTSPGGPPIPCSLQADTEPHTSPGQVVLNSKGELDALSSCSGAKKVSEHIVGDVGTCSFKGFSHQLCVPRGSQLVSGVCLTQGPQNSCPQMAWGDLRITFQPGYLWDKFSLPSVLEHEAMKAGRE